MVGIDCSESVILREGISKPLTNWLPIPYKENRVTKYGGTYVQQNGKPRETARAAKSREEHCARWKKNRQHKVHALRTEYEYSPEEFDKEILSARGSVMSDVVKRFDKDFSRKGNKYRIR